jgi:glycerol-3-phosphate acyltransferase PlsY
MIGLAAVLGLVVGSIPTADWLARRSGVDLRGRGSGNPGANNARRLGGYRLAASVLLVEIAKGAAAVVIGSAIAGSGGAAAAGVGAVLGNVANPWFRLRGGQGLAITGGVLGAAWPPGLLLGLAVILLVVIATKSSAVAALAALTSILGAAVVWDLADLSGWWGLTELRLLLAVGIVAVVAPKQIRKAGDTSLRRRGPHRSRRGS